MALPIRALQVFSFTWDAAELATSDGSLVECKVVGTKTGGSPSVRAAVDVGALEWNAETSPPAGGKKNVIIISQRIVN